MVGVGLRPLMVWLAGHYGSERQLDPAMWALVYAGVIVSAVVTEMTGVHYLFGAFLFGLAMPRQGPLQRRLQLQSEQLVLTLLMPIFFAISGLHTKVPLLQGPEMPMALITTAMAGPLLGRLGYGRIGAQA